MKPLPMVNQNEKLFLTLQLAFRRLVLSDYSVNHDLLQTSLYDLLEGLTGDPKGFGAWQAQYPTSKKPQGEKRLEVFLEKRNGFF
jgi:hypothetical protein